jgi:hypothetical protein
MHRSGVRVVTIKPGPVATAMTANRPKVPLLASPELVSANIYRALEHSGAEVVYVPPPWRWIMEAVRMVPERVFKRLSV